MSSWTRSSLRMSPDNGAKGSESFCSVSSFVSYAGRMRLGSIIRDVESSVQSYCEVCLCHMYWYALFRVIARQIVRAFVSSNATSRMTRTETNMCGVAATNSANTSVVAGSSWRFQKSFRAYLLVVKIV